MTTATVDKQSFAAVQKIIEDLGYNVKRELRTAINATVKKTSTASARKLKLVFPAPIRILKKAVIPVKGGASDGLRQKVVLWEGHAVPLKHLGAKQNKSGVTYKSGIKEKSFFKSAFVVSKFANHAFRRTGKTRLPIEKLYGPSFGDMYEIGGVEQVAIATANEELPKQIKERVRFLTLKAQGKLKGKQR